MVLKTTTLLGNRLCENEIPPMPPAPVLVFRGGSGLQFGMTGQQLATHLLLLGATGAGKTNAILHIIRQLKARMRKNDVMLVFDSKLDFTAFHADGDAVISNRQEAPGRVGWNLFGDVAADGWDREAIALNANEIAEVIFSEQIEASNQPFFPRAACDIFSAIVKAMACLGISDPGYRVRYLNNAALGKYLRMLTARRLIEFLDGFPELRGVLQYIGDGSSDQALGVLAELQAATGKLFVKCFGENGRFSVRNAVKQRNARTVFVEYDPSCGLSLQPMYRILVDLFLKEALSPRRAGGHVYVICDELKLLPHLKHFEDALNFGRSLGLCVVAGIQSMEQLYEVYGEYGGRNIASGFQNSFCFRTNNAASRDYIQGIHGENYTAMQFLSPSGKTAEESKKGRSVEDWDIISLKCGEAIVGLAGEKPFRFYMERYG